MKRCKRTFEELAEYAAGDAPPAQAARLRQHVARCPRCRRRLELLARADAALRALPRHRPSARAILEARRALREPERPAPPEIMTLDEVAAFLRLGPAAFGEVVGELPAFELAGRVRVRRTKLLEWIEGRERDHMRHNIASQIARSVRSGGKGAA
ncbi:MAG: zf-HC2 domain-containing protein [Planctomycetota bacterium]